MFNARIKPLKKYSIFCVGGQIGPINIRSIVVQPKWASGQARRIVERALGLEGAPEGALHLTRATLLA